MTTTLRLGTRGSTLALTQTRTVAETLRGHHPGIDIDIVVIKTEGDIDRFTPLSGFGGRGAFVRSIERALTDGRIDCAVHSLKDLPSRLPDGLVLGAVTGREDPRDVFISEGDVPLDSLSERPRIATGSIRRRAQVKTLRTDAEFTGIRGNVETRLARLAGDDGPDALILAAAGLHRLGLSGRISGYFTTGEVVPAPCQGIIGLECREDDTDILDMVSAVEDEYTRTCAGAERLFIRTLGLGCHEPVGAFAEHDGDRLQFTGYVHLQAAERNLKESLVLPPDAWNEPVAELAETFRRTYNEHEGDVMIKE